VEQAARDGRVRVLPPETAKKIAAGEVIDRPAALIRELVDNAIDAGAASIEVSIEGGGALRSEVIDDGRGMEKADLELCWLPHATSKIYDEDDLLTVETLGFRGEALSSVSAVARLEITTCPASGEAWRLCVGPGGTGDAAARLERGRRARGTTVRAAGLFDSFPARKKFLKRDGAEATLCRQALVDKALAFPEVAFRFVQDGQLKLFLPSVETRRERFCDALLGSGEAAFVHEIAAAGDGFSLSVVVGGPELRRSDRRVQYVIANGRRIQDFGLQQALEYGVQGWFPNGSHPIGAIYLDIDPALADFNIHPAKREARFKDPQSIHRAATGALKDFMRRKGIAEAERGRGDGAGTEAGASPALPFDTRESAADRRSGYAADASYPIPGRERESARKAMEALLDAAPAFAAPPRRDETREGTAQAEAAGESAPTDQARPGIRLRLVGKAFGLFIIVERGDKLFLIDQHAAHERLLYDRLRAKPPARQELLVPYPFVADSAVEDEFLASRRTVLEALGVGIERDGAEGWQLTALPESWRTPDEATVREILDLRKAGADLAERWYATTACRIAAKDGDYLDDAAAEALAEAALALPVPRCPHGRPIWMELGLNDLLKAVRRIE